MGRRGWVAAVLAAVVAAGCGGGDGGGSASAPATDATGAAEEADPEVAFGEYLAGVVDDDGVLGADDGLALFAAVFEPLPDVEVPAELEALAEAGAIDPSLALRAAVDRLASLDAAQAEVVERVAFAGADDAVVAHEPGASGETGMAPLPLAEGETAAASRRVQTEREAEAAALIDRFAREIGARLGRPLAIPVSVVELPPGEAARTFGGTEAAMASSIPDESGAVESCLVRLNPNAAVPLDPSADPRFASQVAHEVFHCFQYARFPGDASAVADWPLWVKEGTAAWAGEELAGGSSQSVTWWINWLRFADRDLVRRSYDAIGFWSLLDAAGIDAWARIEAVMGDVRNGYDVALGADVEAVLSRWGSSLVREPALGDAWETSGPGVVDEAPGVLDVPVRTDADPVAVTNVLSSARTGRPLRFDAAGDVVTVDAENLTGRVRLPGAGDAVFAGSAALAWCLDPAGCLCPDGTPATGPGGAPLQAAEAGPAHLGVASSTSGGRVTIASRSLDAACADRPAATTTTLDLGGAGCLVGTWTSGPWVVPAGTSRGGDGVRLVLEPDGTGSVDYGPMNPAVLGAPPDAPPIETEVRFTGSGPVSWRADGGGLTITYAAPEAFTATSRVVFDGAVVSEESRTFAELLAAGGAPLTAAPFTCEDGGFRIVLPVPGGSGTFELPFRG